MCICIYIYTHVYQHDSVIWICVGPIDLFLTFGPKPSLVPCRFRQTSQAPPEHPSYVSFWNGETSSSSSGLQVPHNHKYTAHIHARTVLPMYISTHPVHFRMYIYISLQLVFQRVVTNASAPRSMLSRCWFPINRGRQLPWCRVEPQFISEVRKHRKNNDSMVV